MNQLKTSGIIQNKWLVVILLMSAYTFSFMDRYVVNLLAEPIKRDFHLSDTQLSLLLGISFALFYATLGIPLGKLSDTKSRTGIIAAGISFWSIMTAFCGLSKNYLQLFLARMGVGIGEATLSPSAYSLITDFFPKRLWATAISVYSLGIYLGSGLAYIAGGKLLSILNNYHEITIAGIGTIFGWQLIFFVFGIPGLVIAFIFLFVKEPVRNHLTQHNSLSDFWQWIKNDGKLFLYLCTGSAVFNIAVYATASWLPSYLKRVHQLGIEETGLLLGLSTLVLPSLGILAGGRIADYYGIRHGLTGRIKVLLYSTLLFIPANLFFPYTASIESTILAMIPHGLLISATVGMGIACIQEIVPAEHRGLASATLLFAQNMIGMGLGPVCVGMLNDFTFTDEAGIAKSLALVAIISLSIASLLFSKALSLSKSTSLKPGVL